MFTNNSYFASGRKDSVFVQAVLTLPSGLIGIYSLKKFLSAILSGYPGT